MARLPWTKFQDFYLRLGVLKVLVAILNPDRRSTENAPLTRRLRGALLTPARANSELWKVLDARYPWFAKQADSKPHTPTVLEALLVLGNCPSQLYAITEKTAYKILDWGHDLKLITSGNQISEKGLLLRSLLPLEKASKFLRGDALVWNPCILSEKEKLFFLFHLCEIDQLTVEILDGLARPDLVDPIEVSRASEITCRAFVRVLDEARDYISSANLPALRRGRELASVMAEELQLKDLIEKAAPIARTRLPKPMKIRGTAGASGKAKVRRTTKNADHQTIPRFEQLVDLGFLAKPQTAPVGSEEGWKERRRWRYQRLPSCEAWAVESRKFRDVAGPWEWRGFAHVALMSRFVQLTQKGKGVTPEVAARILWRAYEKVHRPIGHTPFYSVALIAMIDAIVEGFTIEMADFHQLVLSIKTRGIMQEEVFFASGNGLDKMFILILPGFVKGVSAAFERVPWPEQTAVDQRSNEPRS